MPATTSKGPEALKGQGTPTSQPRIRKLLGWGVLGQMTYVLSQFFILLGLTRFATVEQVGQFGLASAIAIPVFFFFKLEMRVNAAAAHDTPYKFADFRDLLLVSLALGYAVLLALGFGLLSGGALTLLLIFGAAKAAECYSEFCYGVLQRADRMAQVAYSLIARGVASAVCFIVLLWLGTSVPMAFAAHLLVWSLMALLVDHRLARRCAISQGDTGPANRDRIVALARESLPLGANGLLAALQANGPRYIVVWLLDTVALGYFTVVGYAMQAISTVTVAATESIVARFAFYIAKGDKGALHKTLFKFAGLSGAGTVVGVGLSLLIGDPVLQAVFGEAYGGLEMFLAICILAAGLRAGIQILQACLLAARRFTTNLYIRLLATIVIVPTCIAGGLLDGLNGIGWGMCAAFVLQIAALVVAVRLQPWTDSSDQTLPQ